MSKKITIDVPLNRVEGDLEIRVEINDGVVTDAWSAGNMYRGFENIMLGRGALDGLVMTPRICGICSTAHLTAACMALDSIAGITPPPDALRLRNLALMVEKVQSDMRHGFLMFAADFVNPAYQACDLFDEAKRRYQPFEGEAVVEVIRETKKVLGIVAIIGGQWPHSSYMVPGGIVSMPSTGDLVQCGFLLKQYRDWYEKSVLGCDLDRWQAVLSEADLNAWLDETAAHKDSHLGFYIRFAKQIGLDQLGQGHANFISYGAFDLPQETEVEPLAGGTRLFPAGFAKGTAVAAFDESKISEQVACSWYLDQENGRHPSQSVTRPYASGEEGRKYSWAKAPRYDGLPAETGPLSEMLISKHPLFTRYVEKNGPDVFIRELARLVRPAALLPVMEKWISETAEGGRFYTPCNEIETGEGFGLCDVTRGALGHWVRIKDGKIAHYQIIPPTAWNGSPRDDDGVRGPWEEALVGTRIKDISNPVELGHVVRSFDACLVCTVHSIDLKQAAIPPLNIRV